MWEYIDKGLALLEKHLGKRKFTVIKWVLIAIVGISVLLWFADFVVGHLASLDNALHIQLIPSQTNIPTSIFPQILFAILWTALDFVILAGIALLIAVPVAFFTSLFFSPFTTRRIDNVFAELLPIVTKNYESNPTDASQKLLDETQKLSARWYKSRFNKLIRRITQKKEREIYDRRKL